MDVRSPEEHATAHVPGGLNIPLDELPSRLADLPNGTIYLMCGFGKRSGQAARLLSDRGYAAVYMAGGITEWYRAGHPVTHHQAPEDQSPAARSDAAARLLNLLRGPFHGKSA